MAIKPITIPTHLEVRVYQRYGSYVVRACRKTASCTAGPAQSARLLTQKLWGTGEHCIAEIGREPYGDWVAFEITRVEASS